MVRWRDVGFDVRVIGRTDSWNGLVGTLMSRRETEQDEDDGRWPVRVAGHGILYFFPNSLELVRAGQSEGKDSQNSTSGGSDR